MQIHFTVEEHVLQAIANKDVVELSRLVERNMLWYEVCPHCLSKSVYVASNWETGKGRQLLTTNAFIEHGWYILAANHDTSEITGFRIPGKTLRHIC